MKKVRLSLEVSPAVDSTLKRLSEDIGGTKSEVLRKAIALLEVAVEARKRGQKFGLAKHGQELATEIVSL